MLKKQKEELFQKSWVFRGLRASTKDTSRLARNYLDFGHLFEEFFPKYRVRYIGLNDGVDTERGNDFVPIRAYFNEHYCKDLSGKVHSSYMVKVKEGQFTGCLAPFGYKEILRLNHEGYSQRQIEAILFPERYSVVSI